MTTGGKILSSSIPSGVILGTSIGGLAVCAAVAVGFMVLWMHGIV